MVDHECCRMERYKYALFTKFQVPRLYRLAAKGDWGPIPQRCLRYRREVEFIHRYAPGDTALHQILRFPALEMKVDSDTLQFLEKIKVEAISALIHTHRPIASVTDSFGRTPLHLACMDVSNCGETAFYIILEAWPKSAAHQDMEGRAPLHYLVARNDDIPLSMLEKVIATFPAALTMKDLVKETPLNIVESRRSEIRNADVVVQLLKQSDTTAGSLDTGVTP